MTFVQQDVQLTPAVCQLYYVYAVVRPQVGQVAMLPTQGILPGCPVTVLEHAGLVAALSTVPADVFDGPILDQNLEDPIWVQERALAHQATLTALCASYTVAPLSFCTLYREERRVQAMLAENAGALKAVLDRLEGASELGVKVYCDRSMLIAWAIEQAEELSALRVALAVASEGSGFFLRKKIAQAAERLADSLLTMAVEAITRRLTATTRGAALIANQPRQIHGRSDDMALNAAYLVGDEWREQFDATLADLVRDYSSRGLSFELTGPWPAYHFTRQQTVDSTAQAV